jgi:NAD-dependent dihydropyrimidine dehydrogenase PreA subunit
MIEVVLQDVCDGCQACVEVCPRNVFEVSDAGQAVIARQADCQTCFLCELYCPQDAIYVDPLVGPSRPTDPAQLRASGLLGQFRRDSGWGEWGEHYGNEHWRMGEIFARARALAASRPPLQRS